MAVNPSIPEITARRQRAAVRVGGVLIGGDAPIVIQSMTDTDTEDSAATAQQVRALYQAGSELVRVTVNTEAAARQVPRIRDQLAQWDCPVPLIGDFHYNGHRLLEKYPECAKALAKYRINPGNVGFGRNKDDRFVRMIDKAIEYERPVRIGVNWGSLDQELLTRKMNDNARRQQPRAAAEVLRSALVESAVQSAQRAREIGLAKDRIILSSKVSDVQALIAVYRELAAACDYALHLGLTEAGMGSKGIVASTAALAILLQEGIGDTLRISLTPEPGGERTREVIVAQELLQTLGLRAFTPLVAACPGCGRTTSVFFRELAARIQAFVRSRMPVWRGQYPGAENLSLAVMGCVVNGPGESKHADIGISLPGKGEAPAAPVFIEGKKAMTLRGDNIADQFQQIVEDYVQRKYGSGP